MQAYLNHHLNIQKKFNTWWRSNLRPNVLKLTKKSFKYTKKYNSFCRSKFRTKLLKITKKYKNKLGAATRKGLSKRLILLQTLLNKHLYSPPINVTKKKKKQIKRRRTKRKN